MVERVTQRWAGSLLGHPTSGIQILRYLSSQRVVWSEDALTVGEGLLEEGDGPSQVARRSVTTEVRGTHQGPICESV